MGGLTSVPPKPLAVHKHPPVDERRNPKAPSCKRGSLACASPPHVRRRQSSRYFVHFGISSRSAESPRSGCRCHGLPNSNANRVPASLTADWSISPMGTLAPKGLGPVAVARHI